MKYCEDAGNRREERSDISNQEIMGESFDSLSYKQQFGPDGKKSGGKTFHNIPWLWVVLVSLILPSCVGFTCKLVGSDNDCCRPRWQPVVVNKPECMWGGGFSSFNWACLRLRSACIWGETMLRFTVCFHIFSNKRPLVNDSILRKLSDCTICQGFNFTFSVKGGGEKTSVWLRAGWIMWPWNWKAKDWASL